MPPKKEPSKTARNTMMDLLARRNHSELEIRSKLSVQQFSREEIEQAIQYGRDNKWLPTTTTENQNLAQRMSIGLHHKNKGIEYINHFLEEKGLPPIDLDADMELEKARQILRGKQPRKPPSTREETAKYKAKMGRFLLSRGFTMETIRKVLK